MGAACWSASAQLPVWHCLGQGGQDAFPETEVGPGGGPLLAKKEIVHPEPQHVSMEQEESLVRCIKSCLK